MIISPSLVPYCQFVRGPSRQSRVWANAQTPETNIRYIPHTGSYLSILTPPHPPHTLSPASYPPSPNLRLCYLHQKARQPEHIKAFFFIFSLLSSLPREPLCRAAGTFRRAFLTPVLRTAGSAELIWPRDGGGSPPCDRCEFCLPYMRLNSSRLLSSVYPAGLDPAPRKTEPHHPSEAGRPR